MGNKNSKARKNRRPHRRAMPQRPRQHVSESASRRLFDASIPEEWIFRPQGDDYGIDGEIEIFADGQATGRIFKVQLKSTSATGAKALRVRIPNHTAEYYAALKLPILVVLVHPSTKRLYGRWFHSFDPHYGGRTKNGLTLVMEESDRLEGSKWDELVVDADLFFNLAKIGSDGPARFDIVPTAPTVRGVSSTGVILATKDLAAKFPALVQVERPTDASADGTIVLDEEFTKVTFRDVASATAHYVGDDDEVGSEACASIAHDVMVAVALAFDQIGKTDIAARIAAGSVHNSSLISHDDVLFRVIGLLVRAHRILEAVALADELGASTTSDATMLSSLFLTPALLCSSELNAAEEAAVTSHLQRRVTDLQAANDGRDLAIAHYNLGNWLRGRGKAEEAAEHFSKAAEHDPDYWGRPYFPREFAGVLFLSCQFDAAAEMYGRAYRLGERGMTLALQADALMGAGKYAASEKKFGEYNRRAGASGEDEWRLKENALRRIRREVGDAQQRVEDVAHSLSMDVSDDMSADIYRSRMSAALENDALCANAWFGVGLLEGSSARFQEAFEAFAVSAVCAPDDPRPWVMGIIAGKEAGADKGLVRDLITCGYRFNRNSLIETLSEATASIRLGFAPEDLLEEVEHVLSVVEEGRDPTPVQVRFLHSGSAFDTLEIPRQKR